MVDQKKLRAKIEELKHAFAVIHKTSLDESIEMGFVVCKKNEEIFPGGTCRGEKHCLEFINCIEGEPIGSYHTHPAFDAVPTPSLADILYTLDHSYDFTCISAREQETKKEVVACYKLLKETETYKELKRRVEAIKTDTDILNERIETFNKKVDEYTPEEFKKFSPKLEKERRDIARTSTALDMRASWLKDDIKKRAGEFIEEFTVIDLGFSREPKILRAGVRVPKYTPVGFFPPEEYEIER